MTSGHASATGPLAGVQVLDFSSLLPGPLTTLLLAEAGAEVLQVERPPRGDEMRSYVPRLGPSSANYALLNRGKRSAAVDLKDPVSVDRLLALGAETDVVVEQFRPGVMGRLGLGYDAFRAVNPGIVYCSITGFGQAGPAAGRAGHDLNYLAESGLLGTVVDGRGDPHLPPTVIADIAGGTYPAVVNILLALFRRQATGEGCHLDVGMTPNLSTLAYGYLATHAGSGSWPVPGQDLLTGGSPRYRIYRTSDGRHVAAAPLEDRFLGALLRAGRPARRAAGRHRAGVGRDRGRRRADRRPARGPLAGPIRRRGRVLLHRRDSRGGGPRPRAPYRVGAPGGGGGLRRQRSAGAGGRRPAPRAGFAAVPTPPHRRRGTYLRRRGRYLQEHRMRAALVESFGPPESLITREVPDPIPGSGEVLVEVAAAA